MLHPYHNCVIACKMHQCVCRQEYVARNKSGTVQDVPGDSMQETASGAASLDDFMFVLRGHQNQRQSPSCDLSFVSKRVWNSGEKLEVVVEVQHLESSSLNDLEWYIRSSKDFQWSCAFTCKGFNHALDTIFIHCLSCELPVLRSKCFFWDSGSAADNLRSYIMTTRSVRGTLDSLMFLWRSTDNLIFKEVTCNAWI